MIEAIVRATPGREYLDVGMGTGLSARPFRDQGCRVLGIEPDERMAAIARTNGFEVEVARFEEWEPANRLFDAVVSGQSWHWVDPLLGASRAAVALRPLGRIALFWNLLEFPTDLGAQFARVYKRVFPPATPIGDVVNATPVVPIPDRAAGGLDKSGFFGNVDHWSFDWTMSYERDQWLEQVLTLAGHTDLEPSQAEELLEGLGAVIDAAGGSFEMRYSTVVVTAVRRPGAR